ncbi:MAG: hypothetical protein E3J70_11815 [Candidatus Heimdallarchaeota archaeon]|nr:MAG: hypothetical protein E3J70_11815 [Candidatus Heimdallarchaeota archaeon]
MIKLLYKLEKKVRGLKLEIYTDGTSKITSKTSKYGMHIPSILQAWKKIPQNKKGGKRIVIANFKIKDNNGTLKTLKGIQCEIYHNNYEGYIRPLENNSDQKKIKKIMKENGVLTCILHGEWLKELQLDSTKYFMKAMKLRNKTKFSPLKEMELITLGGLQETNFEIYQDNENSIFIKSSGIMNTRGFLVLSNELRRYIKNWFKKAEICVCSVNGDEPIVLSTVIRKRKNELSKLNKEINIPYYGKKKPVEIVFSNNQYQLTKQAKEDYIIKKKLVANDFKIKAFKANTRTTNHYNKEIESRFIDTIHQSFSNSNKAIIYSEVGIILESSEQNICGREKHRFDNIIVIEKKENIYLVLIELKTSFKKKDRFRQLEVAIAKLVHFSKSINKEKIIPILIVNDNMKCFTGYSSKQIYKSFGVELIVLNDFLNIEKKPKLLLDIVENNIETRFKKKNAKFEDLHFIGFWKSNNAGTVYENEIREVLEKEGYSIQSNTAYNYLGKKMEIDHIAEKNNKKIIISCKDRSSVKAYWSVINHIINSLNVLELRMEILGFDTSKLYIKVPLKYKEKIKSLFRNYNCPSNTEIIIN